MKVCRICHLSLPFADFYLSKTNKGGLEHQCKKCKNKAGARRNKKRLEDPEYRIKYNEKMRQRYSCDKNYRNKILAEKKQYSSSQEYRKYRQEYFARNPQLLQIRAYKDRIKYYSDPNFRTRKIQHASKYARKRLLQDDVFRLTYNLRTRLRNALKGGYKTGSAINDLGCSIEELKAHLESKFQPGMSWSNYGYQGWHIDHIRPLSSFDLADEEQLKLACHYSNLQPLWAKDNLRKSDKYEEKDE